MHLPSSKQLRKDLVLRKIIDQVELPPIEGKPQNLYTDVIRSVLFQQLSGKAASTIHGRFVKLFPGDFPEPGLLQKMSDEHLRTAGVSRQKAGYLRNIAEMFYAENLVNADWSQWKDDEIIEHLTRIKGVGTWTAQMILMFTLERPDVFPIDDLGISSAMIGLYKVKEEGRALRKALNNIADNWRPFRSTASRYMWQAKDLNLIPED